jgi:hypothetical protein
MAVMIICGFALGALLAQLFRIFVLPISTLVALVAVAADQAVVGHSFAHAALACLGVAIALQMGFLAGQIPVFFRRSGRLRLLERPHGHR